MPALPAQAPAIALSSAMGTGPVVPARAALVAQLAGQARAARKSLLSVAALVAAPGTAGGAVLAEVVVVVVAAAAVVLVVAERDEPVLGMLAGMDSVAEASAVVVGRMSGAAPKPGPEALCSGPAPILWANHARSECSTWPDPDSGCRSMDNA